MAANVLDKLNKVPVTYKAGGLAIVVILILAAFHFLHWEELENQITRLKSERESLERTYKEQKAVADNLPTFQQNTKKLEEDLNLALTQLPREKEIPSLLRDIYTLGKKSGIEFKTFEPQKETRRQLYSELPIKLQIVGDYHQIAVFFDRVGKLNRIVNISNLDVTTQKGQDGVEILTVNCLATTFMFTGSSG